MAQIAQVDVATSPPPAPLPREAARTLSGLEQVRAMRDGIFGLAPMQALMNMRLIEAEDGMVAFSAVPEEKHYNPRGTIHGAFTAAVLDSAMGLAVFTKLPAGSAQTTLEFKLNSFARCRHKPAR
ncbi:PaaI family thioesterase [Rhodopila sp.]|uniref:PaaI family thioesterase n=1 Tax=Rhodopila sp. TaxID=2480087 RepID=UPI003D0C82A5